MEVGTVRRNGEMDRAIWIRRPKKQCRSRELRTGKDLGRTGEKSPPDKTIVTSETKGSWSTHHQLNTN
jgi:hypothetical protein